MRFICLITAVFWLSTASALDFQAELDRVKKDANAAVNRISALPTSQQSAEHWLLLGYGYMQLLNKEGAMSAVNKALESGLEPGRNIEALHLKALVFGILFRDSQSALEQLKLAEAALEHYNGDDKPQLQTSVYESFAQGYNQRGDIKTAMKYAELSVEIAIEYKLQVQELESRLILGRLALQQNNFQLAQQQLSRALELAQSEGDQASIGSIHLRLGMAYDKLQLHALAAEHLVQAEQFLQMPERRNQLITALLTQIEHWLTVSDFVKANETIEKAKKLLNELKDPYLTAQLLSVEAQLSVAEKKPDVAEQQLLKAAQLFQQLDNRSMLNETKVALADVALMQQQAAKASTYLPQGIKIEQQPIFLQLKYWELLAQIHAANGEWQAAYQAAVSARKAQFEQQSDTNKQQLAFLSRDLQDQKKLQQAEQQNDNFKMGISVLLTALLLSWLGFGAFLVKSQRKQQVPLQGLYRLKSWTEFSKQLRRDQQKQASVHLFAVQIQQVSEVKLSAGEQQIRQALHRVLAALQGPQLLDSTIHTDVLWLSVRTPDDDWLQRLQQAVQMMQQELPEQPAIRIWQGDLQSLFNQDWQEADLNGLRELVWYSFQQQPALQAQILHFITSASQRAPCSWQADNLRQDIKNALALGLLHIRYQPLTSAD